MTTGLTPVMELEAEDGASASQSIITVLGTDRKDLTKLGTMRREIRVALLDPKSDAQFVYPVTVLHSGLLPASDASAGGTSFAPRRFAYREGQQLPKPHASGKVDASVLNAAEYFVTVHLGELLPGLVAEPVAPRAVMLAEMGEGLSPLMTRVDAGARERLCGRREVRVSRPTAGPDHARPHSAIVDADHAWTGAATVADAGAEGLTEL